MAESENVTGKISSSLSESELKEATAESRVPSQTETLYPSPPKADERANAQSQQVLPTAEEDPTPEELYTVFSKRRTVAIVAVIAFAGLLSPLTGNVYIPALPTIQKDLNTTAELINLTVTFYLVFQGLAPSFWATLADVMGRRPIYIASLVVFLGASIGLAETKNYAQLLILRMLQASGSSSVVAIGAGTIADIAPPAVRGTYLGWFSVGAVFGPILGPIIGGYAAQALGWRAIFWILFGICAFILIVLIMLLPETNRPIAGNGSILVEPKWMYTSVVDAMVGDRIFTGGKTRIQKAWFEGIGWKFIYSLTTLRRPHVALLLAYMAIIFGSFYCVTITASYTFQYQYGLSEGNVGLTYLAFAFGLIIGSILGGYILNYDYRFVAAKLAASNAEKKDTTPPKRGQYDPSFPYERARFRICFLATLVCPFAVLGYGWSVQQNANIAAALVMQLIIGFSASIIFTSVTTYLVDISPGKGSSITAANNLARCIFGAICTVWIQPAANGIGNGPIFTIIAGVDFLAIGAVLLVLWRGQRWRLEELDRETKLAQKVKDSDLVV